MHGQMIIELLRMCMALDPKGMAQKTPLGLNVSRLSRIDSYIDTTRPEIVLRSRNKIKLLTPKTNLTKVMKSPYHRGVSMWDRLTEEVQRATMKVRFKRQIA